MTKQLEDALEAVRRMSPDDQNAIARMLRSITDSDVGPEPIDPMHREAVDEGLAEADRGEFATDDDVIAAFRRFEQ